MKKKVFCFVCMFGMSIFIDSKVASAIGVPAEDIFKNVVGRVEKSKTPNFQEVFNFSDTSTEMEKVEIKLDGNPILSDSDPIYFGDATLSNPTDSDLVLKTNSFSKEITETKSSSITGGVMFGQEAKATIGIPLVGSTEYTTKLEVTVGGSKDYSTSTTITYTVDSQEIAVPAHKTYKVNTYLKTASIKGTYKYYAQPADKLVQNHVKYLSRYINANGTTKMVNSFKPVGYTWSSVAKEASELGVLPKELSYKNGVAILEGTGTFVSDYGAKYFITVSDVTFEKERSLGRIGKIAPIVATYEIPVNKDI